MTDEASSPTQGGNTGRSHAKRFNIRVYGLLINEHQEVLLADERRNGMPFTKFPGGGLEWGEGIKECVVREFQEEVGLDVEVSELFYMTDFFQQSAFSPDDQLISVYYIVLTDRWREIPVEDHPFADDVNRETFRWKAISDLTAEDLTFPIDRVVAERLNKRP